MDINNNMIKLITRGLVALYLISLSLKLFRTCSGSDHPALMVVIGCLFVAIGIAFGIYSVRSYLIEKKKQPEETKA